MLFRSTDATSVLPLDFLKLIWGALIGYMAFAEVPDAGVWIGGVTVFAAATYTAYRESQDKAANALPAAREVKGSPPPTGAA